MQEHSDSLQSVRQVHLLQEFLLALLQLGWGVG